jgi:hypothetical protein
MDSQAVCLGALSHWPHYTIQNHRVAGPRSPYGYDLSRICWRAEVAELGICVSTTPCLNARVRTLQRAKSHHCCHIALVGGVAVWDASSKSFPRAHHGIGPGNV